MVVSCSVLGEFDDTSDACLVSVGSEEVAGCVVLANGLSGAAKQYSLPIITSRKTTASNSLVILIGFIVINLHILQHENQYRHVLRNRSCEMPGAFR